MMRSGRPVCGAIGEDSSYTDRKLHAAMFSKRTREIGLVLE